MHKSFNSHPHRMFPVSFKSDFHNYFKRSGKDIHKFSATRRWGHQSLTLALIFRTVQISLQEKKSHELHLGVALFKVVLQFVLISLTYSPFACIFFYFLHPGIYQLVFSLSVVFIYVRTLLYLIVTVVSSKKIIIIIKKDIFVVKHD